MSFRKIGFERVLHNLKENPRTYLRITTGDYSNEGIDLFNSLKFSQNLGQSETYLKKIGLLKIKEQSGWKLLVCPTPEELEQYKEVLSKC